MPFQALDIPPEATEIVAALGLTVGQAYTIQNIGDSPIIANDQNAAPADLAEFRKQGGIIIQPGEKGEYEPKAGVLTYMWSWNRSRLGIVEAE